MTLPMIDLYRRVAAVLSGHPGVEVRLRAPIVRDYDGAAYVYDVRSVIDIRPGHSPEAEFRVLLHECGHLRSGTAGRDINPGLPPETMKLSDLGRWAYKSHPVNVKREGDADRWVSTWLEYVGRRCPETATVEQKLRCLLGWVPLEMRIRAAEVAAKSAADFLEDYLRRQSS